MEMPSDFPRHRTLRCGETGMKWCIVPVWKQTHSGKVLGDTIPVCITLPIIGVCQAHSNEALVTPLPGHRTQGTASQVESIKLSPNL